MTDSVKTLELRWHFPHDIDSGASGLLSGKDADKPGAVLSVHWHPNEMKLLTSGFDGAIKIWSYNLQSPLAESISHLATMFLAERSPCNVARWSPQGRLIGAGYNSGEVVMWQQAGSDAENAATQDSTAGRLTQLMEANEGNFSGPSPIKEFPSQEEESEVTPAARARTSLFDSAYEYNVENWSAVKILRVFGDREVYALSFSHDGRFLLSASQEGLVVIHDILDGYARIRMESSHSASVQGVFWDPWGTYAVSIGADRKAVIIYNRRETRPGRAQAFSVHDNITHGEQGGFLFRAYDASPYYRHGSFSPDGGMMALPCGFYDPTKDPQRNQNSDHAPGKPKEQDPDPSEAENMEIRPTSSRTEYQQCAYVFLRHAFHRPYKALRIKSSVAVIGSIFSPILYQGDEDKSSSALPKDNLGEGSSVSEAIDEGPTSSEIMKNENIWGPAEYLMAIALFTSETVTIFSTNRGYPRVQFSNMHPAPISGLSWCSDGLRIAISSEDGTVTLATLHSIFRPIDASPNETLENDTDNKVISPLIRIYLDRLESLRQSLRENNASFLQCRAVQPTNKPNVLTARRKNKDKADKAVSPSQTQFSASQPKLSIPSQESEKARLSQTPLSQTSPAYTPQRDLFSQGSGPGTPNAILLADDVSPIPSLAPTSVLGSEAPVTPKHLIATPTTSFFTPKDVSAPRPTSLCSPMSTPGSQPTHHEANESEKTFAPGSILPLEGRLDIWATPTSKGRLTDNTKVANTMDTPLSSSPGNISEGSAQVEANNNT